MGWAMRAMTVRFGPYFIEDGAFHFLIVVGHMVSRPWEAPAAGSIRN